MRRALTALTRGVTELTVSVKVIYRLAEFPLFLSRFTVGLVIALPADPHGYTLGREACCAECPPSVLHPFHCWATVRR